MPVWLVALKEDFNRTPGVLGRSKLILIIGSATQSIVIVKQEFVVEVSKVGLPTYGRARVDSLYSLSLMERGSLWRTRTPHSLQQSAVPRLRAQR